MQNKFQEAYLNKFGIIYIGIFSFISILLQIKAEIGTGYLAVLCLIFLPLPIIYIYLFINKKDDDKLNAYEVFNDEKFMVEFINIFIKNRDRTLIKQDENIKIAKIVRELSINGRDCEEVRYYHGKNVKRKDVSGIEIRIMAGSSVSFEELGFVSYDITDERIKKIPKCLNDGERTKTIFLPFAASKDYGEKFVIELHQSSWKGAMRADYDGVFFSEHLSFTKGVDEVEIKISFKAGEIENIIPLIYNTKKHKLSRDLECQVIKESGLNYIWRRFMFEPDDVYMIMYKYITPIT